MVSGAKQWITNGGFADLFILYARTGGPGAKGISCFLAEKGDGFTVGREMPKLGLHTSSTVELAFDGYRVPGDAMMGEEGQGLKIALATLDSGRIIIAAQACGIARAALDVAVGYAQERHAFGGPIARFQGVQFPLAEVAAKLEAARLLTMHAARLRDAGEPAHRRRRQGQALRQPGRRRGRGRLRPDARRLRLLGRVPRRAPLPRRAHHPDLRGHQRDPAPGDRPRPARGRRAGLRT